jgi:hypothetical protein
MATFTIPRKIDTMDTFQVRGEQFVVLKKEYLDELLVLMRSFAAGERFLRERKTRSFSDFLKIVSRRAK